MSGRAQDRRWLWRSERYLLVTSLRCWWRGLQCWSPTSLYHVTRKSKLSPKATICQQYFVHNSLRTAELVTKKCCRSLKLLLISSWKSIERDTLTVKSVRSSRYTDSRLIGRTFNRSNIHLVAWTACHTISVWKFLRLIIQNNSGQRLS